MCKHMTSHDHRDTTLSTSKFIQRLPLLLFILLPIQTRWIAVPATLHGGYWEYGTVSLYATQIFIFLIAAYYLLQTYKNKKQPLSLLIVKSWVGLFITKHKVLTLFLFWLYVLIKKRTWFIPVFKWTLLIALMLVISAAVFEDPFRARTSFVDQSSLAQFRLEEQSQNDRVKQWQEAKDIGFSKTAGVGSGVGNYTAFLGRLFPSREVYQLQPMHSTPVLVGLELGIIGSFLLLLLIIQYIKKFVQHPFGMFLLIAVLGMMLFDHYWWSLYPGVLATTFAFWFAAQNITKPEQLRIFGAS